MPRSIVIPVLAYPAVNAAVEWLCGAFGFTVRLRIGNHRAQLNAGDGAIVVVEGESAGTQTVMVRVEDAAAHYARSVKWGARAQGPPIDYPYGERQYTVEDVAGHRWTFSQSMVDVDPRDWGGELSESASPADR